MEDINKLKIPSPEKILQKSSTLPLYTNLILPTQKSKYKEKKLFRFNSIQKNNETSENTCLTRVNTINRSNLQLVTVSGKKPKGRVAFAPKYRLINYIDFDPKESILKTNNINNINSNKDEENNEKEKNEKNKKKEPNDVTFQCTCILI